MRSLGQEVDLLVDYPKARRNLEERGQKTLADVAIARRFGPEYFDGPRSQGYGGYRDSKRWIPVARRIIDYYGLIEGMSILDVGCAKGFALLEFRNHLPGLQITGLDISRYAVENAPEPVRPHLVVGNAKQLPYPDKSFDLVISINTVHNLDLPDCAQALREIERVKRRHAFVMIDAYHDDEERQRMWTWNLTGQTILSVDGWKWLFSEIGYAGDYYWFMP